MELAPVHFLTAPGVINEPDGLSKEEVVDSSYRLEYKQLKSRILRDDRKIKTLMTESQDKLGGLVARLSFLQSRIIRLEAMGQRIAGMAGLSQSEFDLEKPVGIGGPEPVNAMSSTIDIESLVGDLDILEKTMDDQWQKLSAIEVLLIGQNIQSRTTPAGMPLPSGWVSSGYGMRTDPFTGRREFHQGIDIAGNKDENILAMASGIVTYSGYRIGYGNTVEIRHGDGYKTRYAHNETNLVSVGEPIEKGQAIAVIGSTGRSTGLHVHFEVMSDNVPVNPKRYLQLK